MDLVVKHVLYRGIREDPEKRCGVALEESVYASLSIDFNASSICASPCAFPFISANEIKDSEFKSRRHTTGAELTCVLLKVRIGGLKEDLDPI